MVGLAAVHACEPLFVSEHIQDFLNDRQLVAVSLREAIQFSVVDCDSRLAVFVD